MAPDQQDGQPGNLEARLQAIQARPEFPAFAATIHELLSLLEKPYNTVFEISRVILRDVSLTTKILRMVNSFYFQTRQRQVHTISSAVMLLGFHEIRNLAVGLKLLEQFQPSPGLTHLKKLILQSVFMAISAQELAHLDRRFNTEEIFLTALLFNFNELAVAYYFPKEYQEILAVQQRLGLDLDAAARRVLNVSLDDLGQALFKTWNLPEELSHRLAELKRPVGPGSGEEKRVRQFFQGMQQLSQAMFAGDSSPKNPRRQEEALAMSLGVEPELLARSLNVCTCRLQELAQVLNLPVKDLLLRRVETGDSPESAPEPEPMPWHGSDRLSTPATTGQDPPPDGVTDQELERWRFRLLLVEDINQAIACRTAIHQVLVMILEGIHRGLGFDRVAICLVNPQRTWISGRFGLGAGVEEILPYLETPLTSTLNALSLALTEGSERLLNQAAEPRDRLLMEPGFWEASQANLVVACPILLDMKPIGVIYADRRQCSPTITASDLQHLRTFRDLAVIALRQCSRRCQADLRA